ncbi:unnamed protein product, partial [Effrenium voratum]
CRKLITCFPLPDFWHAMLRQHVQALMSIYADIRNTQEYNRLGEVFDEAVHFKGICFEVNGLDSAVQLMQEMFVENLGEWSFVADELDLHEEEGWAWCRFQVSEPSPRLLLARMALSPEELVGSFEEWMIELPPQAPATPAFRGAPLTPPPLQAAPSPGRAGFAATPPLAFKEAAPRTPDFPVRRAAARPQKRQKKA